MMTSFGRAMCLALCGAFVGCICWAQDIHSTYAANCANCHGADGGGNTALGRVPKLRDLRSPEVQRLSEGELLGIISKGAGRGGMPGFQKKLGSETVRKLAAFIRQMEIEPVSAVSTKHITHSKNRPELGDVKNVYSARCSHCHGADGSGDTALGRSLKLRDMRSAEAQNFSDEEIVGIIAQGTDRGRMPGFRKKLGDDMVQKLASYVRGLPGKPPVEITKEPAPQMSTERAVSEATKPEVKAKDQTIQDIHPESQTQEHAQVSEVHVSSRTAKTSLPPITPPRGNFRTELVDLNSASKETLMTLPGIAETDTDRIIAGRPYKSTLQFKTRRVISGETYTRIAGRVVAKKPVRTAQKPTRRDETQ